MTNKDAYKFGWVYGVLTQAIRDTGNEEPYNEMDWSQRPFRCLAAIMTAARQCRALTPEVEGRVAPVLASITIKEAETDGGAEKVQPLPIQGSWQLGYYAGLGGTPMQIDYNLQAKRKAKGLTQVQLAEQLGVGQSKISEWEKDPTKIPDRHMAKLHELLG